MTRRKLKVKSDFIFAPKLIRSSRGCQAVMKMKFISIIVVGGSPTATSTSWAWMPPQAPCPIRIVELDAIP